VDDVTTRARTPEDDAGDARPARVARDRDIAAGALRGVTVLLVEDERSSREALALILAHYGARVVPAASMREAVDRYCQSTPSILVCDIGLGQSDGYTVLRLIRARERHPGDRIPAIAVSGFSSRESGQRAREAGFDAFLRKPIDVAALLKLVYRFAAAG